MTTVGISSSWNFIWRRDEYLYDSNYLFKKVNLQINFKDEELGIQIGKSCHQRQEVGCG